MNTKAEIRAIVYELYGDEETKEQMDERVEWIWNRYTTRLAAMGLVPPSDEES